MEELPQENMNRIERISAILIQLQSKKVVKGQEIADRFGISLRTAYRDIRALELTGIPITSEAGLGYSLVDGYKLPPVMFTKEEAISFITAEKLIEKLTDEKTHQTYLSGLLKIKAVLPTEDKVHAEKMNQAIEVLKNPFLPEKGIKPSFLPVLTYCILHKKALQLEYKANYNQETSNRLVEPVGIFMNHNQWYLIAYCLLRNDYRNFRLDRIGKCAASSIDYLNKHPSLKAYLNSLTKDKEGLHAVTIKVNNNSYMCMGEQKYYHGFVSEKRLKNHTEMTFLSSSLEGMARWYLMYGDQAEILHPPALKKEVKQVLQKIRKKL